MALREGGDQSSPPIVTASVVMAPVRGGVTHRARRGVAFRFGRDGRLAGRLGVFEPFVR